MRDLFAQSVPSPIQSHPLVHPPTNSICPPSASKSSRPLGPSRDLLSANDNMYSPGSAIPPFAAPRSSPRQQSTLSPSPSLAVPFVHVQRPWPPWPDLVQVASRNKNIFVSVAGRYRHCCTRGLMSNESYVCNRCRICQEKNNLRNRQLSHAILSLHGLSTPCHRLSRLSSKLGSPLEVRVVI